jgi:phenol 2-monooxygenase
MLDQLSLFDSMAQTGLISRRSTTWKDGRRQQGRGWRGIEDCTDTFFDFMLNIRLKYSEDIFREKIEELGRKVEAPVKLVDFVLDENARDDWKVTATCARLDGSWYKVKAKYIIGCDGGSSAVRRIAEIPMLGEDKEDHWVRIDGIVKTDVPDSRLGFAAIESKTHGHVLWVALDHGATRIGYVLTPAMYKKYGRSMSKEDAVKEAQAAVAPFKVEFLEVHWHTVYGVKQHVAARLHDRERILLAGDAAHTHSSGSAQGMNTGTHDAVNLGWRLAGVINGWYKPEILGNYSDERKAAAQQLIDNDKIVSALISGHKPEKYKDRPEDTNTLFDEALNEQHPFMFGLGIEYKASILNDAQNSYPPIAAIPGQRAPDVLVWKNGFSRLPIRLYEVTKNNGKFHILVFAGEARDNHAALQRLRSQVDKLASPFEHAVAFCTLIAGKGLAFAEHMGIERQFGDAYWDLDHRAHEHYKIPLDLGALVVLRPDGILGFVARLDGFDKVANYLAKIVIPREQRKVATNGANGHVGEMINQDENNLYYQQAREQGLPQSVEEGSVAAR